jgi:hypothetical protein
MASHRTLRRRAQRLQAKLRRNAIRDMGQFLGESLSASKCPLAPANHREIVETAWQLFDIAAQHPKPWIRVIEHLDATGFTYPDWW